MEAPRRVWIVGAADGVPTPHDGRWLVSWNPHTEFGVLELTSTDKRSKASIMSLEEIHAQWAAQSRMQPLRPNDGQPNRPLTAVTIEIMRA